MRLVILFIERLKYHFNEELKGKTGWGRVEVSSALQRSIDKALVEIAE